MEENALEHSGKTSSDLANTSTQDVSDTAALQARIAKLETENQEMTKLLQEKETTLRAVAALESHWRNECNSLAEANDDLLKKMADFQKGPPHAGGVVQLLNGEKCVLLRPPPTVNPGDEPPVKTARMSNEMGRTKCANFVTFLVDLSRRQSEEIRNSVTTLVQRLISGTLSVEDFGGGLDRAIKLPPNPCLVPFLKKNILLVREAMAAGEVKIEGITPPILNISNTAGSDDLPSTSSISVTTPPTGMSDSSSNEPGQSANIKPT